MPDSMTQILSSGPPGTKINIAVLGDGFASADQTAYNNKVNDLLFNGLFKHDYFYEDIQAFNVYRVNLESVDSGVGVKTYDNGTLLSTVTKNTALGYYFNGSWSHCWLEGGPNTGALVTSAFSTWVPDYNLCLILLNNPGFGGCGGGGFAVLPLGVSWDTVAHEFGHGMGGLCDEYCAQDKVFTGPEPGCVDMTINTNRATLKWARFVNPATPLPTGVGKCAGYTQGAKPADWDDNQSVGLFEGGATVNQGVYRPVINCRMSSNLPPYCPVCYTQMKSLSDSKAARTFLNCYAGDFNGDGKSDVLIHNTNGIVLYRSNGSQLNVDFSVVDRVPGSWQFQAGDKFFIADFNGDGKDEVLVFNGTNWVMPYLGLLADDGSGGLKLIARYDGSMPGWQFTSGDQFFVGDFNGDGKADVYVFNGGNWVMPYLGHLRSSGTGLSLVKRYDGNLPGWETRPSDRFFVGDFNGDKKADLFVFNGDAWSIPYLGMLTSNGTSLSMTKRFDGNLPGWETRPSDNFFVGDFDGDGKADLYVFNGTAWSLAYLGMLKSTGSDLVMTRRYDGNAPGWQMRAHDRHYVADINGDKKSDLFVFNADDWGPVYLGRMISNGAALGCDWAADWIGGWHLGTVDRFEPCNYQGAAAGRPDLFVHNTDWFGMIRSASPFVLDNIYYRWIHNYRYGHNF
jgi:hypothetical protein